LCFHRRVMVGVQPGDKMSVLMIDDLLLS
jgi:hypothetical protein